jgi:uncharacterized protein (DUF697 family)/predicted GTPase
MIGAVDRLWSATSEAMFGGARRAAAVADEARRRAQAVAPVVWLIGKTGAGKTSIIAALTDDPRAVVGEGFAPCTRTASVYDVPADAPVLRFLDTRGIGEADYDPSADIAWCEGQSHLLLAVAQVADPTQDSVVQVLREARRRHPDWPIVVAQTGLHRLYPVGARHAEPYPGERPLDDPQHPWPWALRQAITHQRRLFERLSGPPPRFVPIDFTAAEDLMSPLDYGLEALWTALAAAGPEAIAALARAQEDAESDRIRAHGRPLIFGYGAAAAGAGAVPIPLVGASGLAGVLALMLRTLAGRYGVTWTPAALAEFSGAVGGGALAWTALRYGFRELLKLVPVVGTVAAGALNSAAAFAVTVGIGEAACVWLRYRRRGETAPNEEVRRAFAQGMGEGLRQARPRRPEPAGEPA